MTSAHTARRRRLPAGLVLVAALVAVGGLWAAFAPGSHADESTSSSFAVKQGRALFLQGCSSCHGLNAQGGNQAPSLIGVGSAAVDFQVGTGRMPLGQPGAQAERKPPVYNQTQIDQLAAYIASLAPGPDTPKITQEDLDQASLSEGGDLFRANCASCHQAIGQGGALTNGKHAPNLEKATPKQIVEAMRTGPESMPVFGNGTFSDEQAIAIAKYVKFVTDPKDPGGNAIGHFGPIPEGLVAWVVGIGGLVAVILWIGSRKA
jgi:ubiquinol-cytochrome c reductase cytochrome c subunit